MIVLIYFYHILTSLDRKKSRIPRRTSSCNNNSVKNKYVTDNMINFDNKLEKYELEVMIRKEEEELLEFEKIEKEIEEEYINKKKINHHNCRRLKYEFELQLHDMINKRKMSPANSDVIINYLQICFDNFLKIFSDYKSSDPDLLKFQSVLNYKIKKILLEFTSIVMINFQNSRKYEIKTYLDRITKILKEKHYQDERLLFETAEFLQKIDLNNDLLSIYCCYIRQYSQLDTNKLNLFFSLYLYFYRNIASKIQIFNFENIDYRFERLCNYNLLFFKNLLTTIQYINDGIKMNNDVIVQFCKSLIKHHEKSNMSFTEYYESWVKLYNVLSRLQCK